MKTNNLLKGMNEYLLAKETILRLNTDLFKNNTTQITRKEFLALLKAVPELQEFNFGNKAMIIELFPITFQENDMLSWHHDIIEDKEGEEWKL